MKVQGAAEVLQKRDVPAATAIERLRGRAQQALKLDGEDAKQAALERRIAGDARVQVGRQRQHPLSQRHVRQDRVDQVRRGVGGAAAGTGGAKGSVLAAERDQRLLATVGAAHPNEPLGQHPAIHESPQGPPNVARRVVRRQERIQVIADDGVQDRPFRLATDVRGQRKGAAGRHGRRP